MRDCDHGRFPRQVNFFRQQLLQDGQLPFGDILNERSIEQQCRRLAKLGSTASTHRC